MYVLLDGIPYYPTFMVYVLLWAHGCNPALMVHTVGDMYLTSHGAYTVVGL